MQDADVITRAAGALGHITLNRPKALNALTEPMCETIFTALKGWAHAPEIETVLIDAVPGRAFCAGGDMCAIHDLGKADMDSALDFFRTEYGMNRKIAELAKPYVAILDGVTMGGGAGISVHGRFRVATENTLFAMPETAIGFFPDIGASYFLSRLPGELGTYLGLTGARIGAADMLHAGLATHFVPAMRANEIAPRLEAGEAANMVLASLAAEAGRSDLMEHRNAIDRAFSASTVEEIVRALTIEGEWGAETASILASRSPTSLKLTLRQLRKGAQLDLGRCLEMELGIAAEILKTHDFYEGVRAVLIDKDHSPRWNPGALEAVAEAEIDRFLGG